MNAFSRSWSITKLTFQVMRKDKELLLFPILGGVFSILFFLAMVFPMLITSAADGAGIPYAGNTMLFIYFLTYLGLAFIATFFNVCVVYTAKKRFEGGNATFWESIRFAFKKIGLILGWSLLSATVGLILRVIDDAAERMGGIGEIIVKIITGMLGAAWAILTIFVVPGMVYNNLGPFAAIKHSGHVLKKTWGESIIREFGLGLMQFVLIILGIVVGILLVIVAIPLGSWAMLAVIALCVIYFLMLVTMFSVANSVFNTALYAYAEGHKLPHEFSKELLGSTFKRKHVQADY